MKKLTIEQLENILKEYCIKSKLKYRGISYDPNCKWFVFSYAIIKISEWCDNSTNECYCMSLDDDFRFTSVRRGLTKQLMGYKVVDIENVTKTKKEFHFG